MNKSEINRKNIKIEITVFVIIVLVVLFSMIYKVCLTKSKEEKNKLLQENLQQFEENVLNEEIVNKENQQCEDDIPEGPWRNIGNGVLKSNNGEIVEIGKTTYTTFQVFKKMGLPINVQKYSGKWVVIGIEENKLKLVSAENVGGNITIGTYSQKVDIKELQEIYPKGNFIFQKGMWSYAHAIEELNLAAQNATGIDSARSITIEDLESKDVLNIQLTDKRRFDFDYGKVFKYYLNDGYIYSQNIEKDDKDIDDKYEEWSPRKGGNWKIFRNSDGIIINEANDNIVKLKYNHYYYIFTDEQKIRFANSLLKGDYWLASPSIVCKEDYAIFFLRRVEKGGTIQRTYYVIFLWVCMQ